MESLRYFRNDNFPTGESHRLAAEWSHFGWNRSAI
jgi:hypothetical protein